MFKVKGGRYAITGVYCKYTGKLSDFKKVYSGIQITDSKDFDKTYTLLGDEALKYLNAVTNSDKKSLDSYMGDDETRKRCIAVSRNFLEIEMEHYYNIIDFNQIGDVMGEAKHIENGFSVLGLLFNALPVKFMEYMYDNEIEFFIYRLLLCMAVITIPLIFAVSSLSR